MKLQLGVVSLISLLSFWRSVLGGQIPNRVSESVKRTPGKLRVVVENSGVCGWLVPSLFYNSTCVMPFLETTPGVYQASGYGDLTETESLWCNCFILLRSVSDLLQVLVFCRSQKSRRCPTYAMV